VFWFRVPFLGSLTALMAATLVLLVSTQGLGLLLSTFSTTQQQAMLSATFVIMPMFILSGFALPIHNMPLVLQWLSTVNPLRYYLVINRDLFLQGGGLTSHPFEMAMMATLGLAALALAALRLR